jgi:hypothetical protein
VGLLIYKAGKTSGDYHGEMNHMNFGKWISERVIPNLPPASVIVMDNAPYHSKQEDKPPSKYQVNREIIAWLQRRRVACDTEATLWAEFLISRPHDYEAEVLTIQTPTSAK